MFSGRTTQATASLAAEQVSPTGGMKNRVVHLGQAQTEAVQAGPALRMIGRQLDLVDLDQALSGHRHHCYRILALQRFAVGAIEHGDLRIEHPARGAEQG